MAGIPFTLAQVVGREVVEQPAGPGAVRRLAAVDELVQIPLIAPPDPPSGTR